MQSQNQKSEKLIGSLIDKSSEVFKKLDNKIYATYKTSTEKIATETTKAIESIEEIKVDSKKRFDSYYNRKKIIDYLIYINLAITPILLLILSYVIFIKK